MEGFESDVDESIAPIERKGRRLSVYHGWPGCGPATVRAGRPRPPPDVLAYATSRAA